LNRRKKTKADGSRLIPRKHTDTSVLLSVETNVSWVHLGDFSSKVGKDAEVLKGVIGQHGDADVNDGAKRLLQLCRDNALCIMNTAERFFTIASGAEISWVNHHSLICATFQLACSDQCRTFVSK